MTKHEKAEILQAIANLAMAFERDISEDRMKIYLEDLKDLPVDRVLAAIRQARRTCKFFPSIAELRELAGSGENKQALEDQAALAWDRLRCLRRGYRHEALACPITKKCWLALGGTNGFAVWDYEAQEQWKRKEFISLYLAYARTAGRSPELTHEDSANLLQRLNMKGTA